MFGRSEAENQRLGQGWGWGLGGGLCLFLFLLFLYALFPSNSTPPTYASAGGRIYYSGNPATLGGQSCSSCHNSMTHEPPEVWIEGPTAVLPHQTATYTLTIRGGPAIIGGFNVSATAGTLQTSPNQPHTQSLPNIFLGIPELTHTEPPPSFDEQQTLSFTFRWQAPPAMGEYLLYGAGLSANASGDSTGDTSNTTIFPINVVPGQNSYLPYISHTTP
jgi:hypothetical protein